MRELPRILPVRAGETDDERRLREAINRLGGQLMQTVDSAIAMRTATGEAQRIRHIARNDLRQFALNAMLAFHLVNEPKAD
jgi:hypothetical protein